MLYCQWFTIKKVGKTPVLLLSAFSVLFVDILAWNCCALKAVCLSYLLMACLQAEATLHD